MSSFRSFSEIVATMIQRLQLTQPNLDTKPGTVSRDLFIDIPADQIARLYSAINLVSEKQSLASTSGRDLDKLASNFGVSRNTGSAASGIVVFCTNSLISDIPIPSGTLVTARNGATYRTIGNFVMSSVDKDRLAANVARMRKSLNIAGINSRYALEVPVQSARNGSTGNVSSLQVVSTNLSEPVAVTNLTAMSGGANSETDNSFRSRILSIFSGANIGTSFGYKNALMGVSGVIDALVVEPGSSLMLRDGTETLEQDDGSSRILNSGTGGKVDAYILGRKIQEVSESYIFTDLSGTGDISDDRNDYILGQTTQDLTRTSEERRVMAFRDSNIPAQPVDSVVSITGSSSGVLLEQYTDLDGNIKGNYVLDKDYNPETGGSPFGFDKISFISNTKEVNAEGIIKKASYGPDALSFNQIGNILEVYSDIEEFEENSNVSVAGSSYIKLLHAPVINVSKISNKTTGEVYSIVSQGRNNRGINEDGIIEISGRSLPAPSDILAVNYTWRHFYDPYIDYAGSKSPYQFSDLAQVDVIDWSSSGGVFEEQTSISRSEDGLVYECSLTNTVSRPISLYRKDVSSAQVSIVTSVGSKDVIGIEIDMQSFPIDNIISVKRESDGLELFDTAYSDGSFSSRTIYLPSDSQASVGDAVSISYNKVELFDLEAGDGSYYNNKITLPSETVLEKQEVLEVVEDLYFSLSPVYASYVADSSSAYLPTNLGSLPLTSADSTNNLFGSDNFSSQDSNQPIFYSFDSTGSKVGIDRFGPAPCRVSVSGISAPGKIKVEGETLTRLSIEVQAGTVLSGDIISLDSEIKEAMDLRTLPDTVGIARVDMACVLNPNGSIKESYDIFGSSLENTDYAIGSSVRDDSLYPYQLRLPKSSNNSTISISSGSPILLHVLVYNKNDYEELYFGESSDKITSKRFGIINRVSVSSGFRAAGGSLSGSISIKSFSQPAVGDTYYVDYDFVAPKEGERLTVSYNVNRLIVDSTVEVERVRPITADILIKEAEVLEVDVSGTILLNEDSIGEADLIADSVVNAVSNMLSTGRLGATVDYSDVITAAAGQNGVDSVNISMFNQSGKTGRKAFIKSLDNQTISPGDVSFEVVSRSKFRIN